jgi:hypothetical protein
MKDESKKIKTGKKKKKITSKVKSVAPAKPPKHTLQARVERDFVKTLHKSKAMREKATIDVAEQKNRKLKAQLKLKQKGLASQRVQEGTCADRKTEPAKRNASSSAEGGAKSPTKSKESTPIKGAGTGSTLSAKKPLSTRSRETDVQMEEKKSNASVGHKPKAKSVDNKDPPVAKKMAAQSIGKKKKKAPKRAIDTSM